MDCKSAREEAQTVIDTINECILNYILTSEWYVLFDCILLQ